MIHIALPSGGQALVAANIQPETLEALDQMCRAAVENVREQIDEQTKTGRLQPIRATQAEEDAREPR